MPRTIAAWMALIAALALAIAALREPSESWAVAILATEAVGLALAIGWGMVRRDGRCLGFAAGSLVGLLIVETPAVRGRLAIDAALEPIRARIAPDREGRARLPRSSFDESFSRWIEDHSDRQFQDVTLDEDQVLLHWFVPTQGPFRAIAGRLLALLPGVLIAVILTLRSRRRVRRKEPRQCPA